MIAAEATTKSLTSQKLAVTSLEELVHKKIAQRKKAGYLFALIEHSYSNFVSYSISKNLRTQGYYTDIGGSSDASKFHPTLYIKWDRWYVDNEPVLGKEHSKGYGDPYNAFMSLIDELIKEAIEEGQFQLIVEYNHHERVASSIAFRLHAKGFGAISENKHFRVWWHNPDDEDSD